MDEVQKDLNPVGEETSKLKGLYKNVNVSVEALNRIIIICVLLIIAFVAINLRNPGLTVTFNSMGGSDVVPQEQMYGELLDLPEAPAREGYAFTGWYKDYACFELWDVNADTIQSDMTLYAGWQKMQ